MKKKFEAMAKLTDSSSLFLGNEFNDIKTFIKYLNKTKIYKKGCFYASFNNIKFKSKKPLTILLEYIFRFKKLF